VSTPTPPPPADDVPVRSLAYDAAIKLTEDPDQVWRDVGHRLIAGLDKQICDLCGQKMGREDGSVHDECAAEENADHDPDIPF